MKPFKENRQRVRFLDEDEEAKLKSVFASRHWPQVEIALHTGMRRGEMFNLRWADVDFPNQTITVSQSKSGEMRHIPMNDLVLDVLRRLPSRLKSEWVFPSATGTTPMDGNNFTKRIFNPGVKKAGIENSRWHDLRHTFASRLVMKGNDLRTVQELMGHKKIEMTLHYSHLSPAHKMTAVQTLIQGKNESQTGTTTGTRQNKGARHDA